MKVKITTKENMEYFKCAKNTIVEVELEDYITCVVAGEIGNAKLEACKAQAIAARTFAISRGVLEGKVISDSASSAQAYRANRINYKVCRMASDATIGQILVYAGKPISAVYCESNGGRIRSAEEIWGNPIPYLISKQDQWSKGEKNGHGVGMSQEGIKLMALWDKNYKQMLEFYYPGARIVYDYKALFAHAKSLIKKILGRL